eukprot:scaffold178216_cov41-Attheya_sp.AAC.2
MFGLTPWPTSSLTRVPTVEPTEGLTHPPTSAATSSPTVVPTDGPTYASTTTPTPVPTVEPTDGPTEYPMKPSGSPTVILSGPSVAVFCLHDSLLNFTAHEYAANELEGHVVSILSAEDNLLVVHISHAMTWIGLVDYDHVGDFVWTDGLDVNFTSWMDGEPNNYRGKENCTTIGMKRAFPQSWNDDRCSKKLPAVYKLPISSLCGAISDGYTCYQGNSTGCSSSLNCKREMVCSNSTFFLL